MATQVVKYCTCEKLTCSTCLPAGIKLCVPGALTESGYGFLDATVTVEELYKVSCNQVNYRYTFTYEGLDLADPEVPLAATQITGVICESCWTSWVEQYVGEIFQEHIYDSDIIYSEDAFQIRPDTILGDNTKTIGILSGNNDDPASGAYLFLAGNESPSNGQVQLSAGNASDGHIYLVTNFITGRVRMFITNLERWLFDENGALRNNATNGGDIIFAKATTGIQLQSGANGRAGTFTMNGAAAVVVGNTSLAAGDTIEIFRDTPAGTPGAFNLTARTDGVSFTVTGTALDTSGMRYILTRVN